MEEFDYVIVGSGSAGSVLAYRLTEGNNNTVCVLEFGDSDWSPLIQMPAALSYPMNMSKYDWEYVSVKEPHLNDRELACPRGKVIGGSSSINGMVYVRGHAGDYDKWEELGAKGWSYKDVLPYFKRMETSHGGEAGWRGTNGPLHVTRGDWSNPLHAAFVKAGTEAGYPATDDYNGSWGEGFGAMERTVHKGMRWSAATAYLKPAIARGNTKLIKRALARKVIFDGRTAVGIEYEKGGQVRTVRARKEVVLSAGSINSPKLLQLSGVGDPELLKQHDIDVVKDVPGVGENLQEHPEVHVQWECKQPITLNKYMNIFSKASIGAEWLFLKKGLGATNHFESCAFIRHKSGVPYPNLEFHFMAGAIQYDGKSTAAEHGFQVLCAYSRPDSRGYVRIKGNDPWTAPEIFYNFYDHPLDWEVMRSGIKLIREVVNQPAMAPYMKKEIRPGDSVTSDEDIDSYLREMTEGAYHPCSTCRMGAPEDEMAVVDPECRVFGVDKLRVVDSSIIPQLTMGNINAPSILIGEKGADHILGRDPLPGATQEPVFHPNWESAQR